MASMNISTITKNLSSFLQDHKVSFTNGILLLFTLGGEQIFRFSAFKCPCTQPEAFRYAVIFIVCPAIVLALMGVVINNVTWRICHGCCYRSSNTKHGFWNSCFYWITVLARAFIVPCAWIFLTLLDGDYYFCMLATAPCTKDSEEKKKLVSQSQVIGWIYLVTLLGAVIIALFIARCLDKMTYFENRFVILYREAEEIELEKITKIGADQLAESSAQEFLVKSEPQKEDWDFISKMPDSTVKFNEKDIYVTHLQKWIREKKAQNVEEKLPEETAEHNV